MEMSVQKPAAIGPHLSAGGERVAYLVEAASLVERRVLARTLAAWQATTARAEIYWLPSSRRRRKRRLDPAFEAALSASDDPWFVPVRLIWHPPQRNGVREARLRDLLTLGDPRDPGWLRQMWILARSPDRWEVVVGEAARLSELRERWQQRARFDREHTLGLPEFVLRQAALALDRAERCQRGARYKVPRFVHEEILSRPAFRAGVARLARQLNVPEKDLLRQAAKNLREIAATHSPYIIDLVANLVRILYRQGYAQLVYDQKDLARVAELLQRFPVCFLPSHKSNLDHLVLQYALHENGLPPNHTAGGDNMNFFPVGPLVRRSGVFFIRRSFKEDALYKFVLHQYIDYLVEKRFSLEWYIEGGRSRSGKLLPPRYGLLAYVVDAYRRGKSEDVVLLPVSITYDQIQDISEYLHEHRGVAKERESLRWLVRVLRRLRRRYGNIHIRFGEPLALSQVLPRCDESAPPSADETELAVRKIAFEVCVRMNRATPMTPISLLAMVLLSAADRALSLPEICTLLADLCSLVERRQLPVTSPVDPHNPEAVEAVLRALEENGVASRFTGGPQTVYAVVPEQALVAAYYRNTIVHFFVTQALAELALLAAAEASERLEPTGPRAQELFWQELLRLRDLFKFEFFFPEKEEFRRDADGELALHDPQWQGRLASSPSGAREVLARVRPYVAPGCLRAFAEAYRVVAHALLLQADPREEEKRFLQRCMGLARQYHLQRRVRSSESLSQVLFRSALALAHNQGLTEPGPQMLAARERFAAEWDAIVRRLDAIEALATARFATEVAAR